MLNATGVPSDLGIHFLPSSEALNTVGMKEAGGVIKKRYVCTALSRESRHANFPHRPLWCQIIGVTITSCN